MLHVQAKYSDNKTELLYICPLHCFYLEFRERNCNIVEFVVVIVCFGRKVMSFVIAVGAR